MEEKSSLESLGTLEKKQALDNFLRYRKKFSEEIPEGADLKELLLNKENELDKYKCSESFFSKVSLGANVLIGRKIIKDPGIIENIKEFTQFVNKLKEEKFSKKILANKEDINKINEFLDYIISELQK